MIVDDPNASLLYRPILQLPDHFSGAERDQLARAYSATIQQSLVPGYRRLAVFLREEYLPKTRSTFAWSDLPGGGAWYDYLVKNELPRPKGRGFSQNNLSCS